MRECTRHILETILQDGDTLYLEGERDRLDEAEGVGAGDEGERRGEGAVGCWGGGETVDLVGCCDGVEGDDAGGVAGGGLDGDFVGEGVAGGEVADYC